MIVAGATAYSRIIDPGRSCAASPTRSGALLLFDAAHIAGLDRRRRPPDPGPARRRRDLHDPQDAAGPARRRDPVPPSYAAAIDKAVFPGLQGGPLEHVIAAKAVAFREAAQPEFARVRGPDRPQRPGPGRGPWPARASASSRAAPTTT